MQITIQRSGGYAGITETLVPPTTVTSVVRDHLARLEALLAKSTPPTGADFQRYVITLTEPGKPPRILSVIDDARPDNPILIELHAILSLLTFKR